MPQDNLAIASSTADLGKIFQFRKSEIKEFRNLNINLEVNRMFWDGFLEGIMACEYMKKHPLEKK